MAKPFKIDPETIISSETISKFEDWCELRFGDRKAADEILEQFEVMLNKTCDEHLNTGKMNHKKSRECEDDAAQRLYGGKTIYFSGSKVSHLERRDGSGKTWCGLDSDSATRKDQSNAYELCKNCSRARWVAECAYFDILDKETDYMKYQN